MTGARAELNSSFYDLRKGIWSRASGVIKTCGGGGKTCT